MKSTILAAVLLLTVVSGTGRAAETGYGVAASGASVPALPAQSAADFAEGWNEDLPFVPGATYLGTCYAFPFSPGSSYALTRIEFMGGGVAGTARIEIRADSGSGYPDGALLASGSFEMTEEVGWQGADLDAPVAVAEGEDYYIVYEPVLNSFSALADPDDAPPGSILEVIPHYYDCPEWDGPYAVFLWMAKFYEGELVPNSGVSWSTAKALYR